MSGTELAVAMPTDLVAAFAKPETIDSLIEGIREKVRQHEPDLTTAKGRDAIKSLAYAVSRSKTALDEAGKKLTEDQQRQIDAVNAQRRKVRQELDALRDEARRPLDEWEAAEDARKAALQSRLRAFDPISIEAAAAMTAADFADRIAAVEAIATDDTWQERQGEAALRKDRCLAQLRPLHQAAIDREAQAAELAKLRAEAEAREAREAAEREAAAAEAAAKAAAEQERLRAEREAAAIEAAKIAARQRAEQEAAGRIAAAERAAAKAREDAERAAQAERDRAEAERRRIADEEAARARNIAHVQSVRRAAKEALIKIGLSEDQAVDVVMAIHRGSIPNVTISY